MRNKVYYSILFVAALGSGVASGQSTPAMPGADMPPALSITEVQQRLEREAADSQATARYADGEFESLLPSHGMPAPDQIWEPEQREELIVRLAERYLGLPYLYGGSSPQTGFDCSGYTGYLYARFGVSLPRSARAQHESKQLTATQEPRPGDLVFFKIDHRRVSHVGMYVGENVFIHSPRTGKSIEYADLRLGYWQSRFAGYRRPK